MACFRFMDLYDEMLECLEIVYVESITPPAWMQQYSQQICNIMVGSMLRFFQHLDLVLVKENSSTVW